jgi:hypothetical protein
LKRLKKSYTSCTIFVERFQWMMNVSIKDLNG